MGAKSFLGQQKREVHLHLELEEVFSRNSIFLSLFSPAVLVVWFFSFALFGFFLLPCLYK